MEVLLPIAASLFVIGMLSGLLLLARRAAISKPISFGSPGRLRMFSFPRRQNPGSEDQRSLRVLKQVVLTPSHRLHLLLVAGDSVLLCTHPQGCTVIPATGSEVDRMTPSGAQQPGERSVS